MDKAPYGSALVLVAVLLASGCANPGEAVPEKEDLLARAGFTPKRLTPRRVWQVSNRYRPTNS